jgi:hypothetical protein
MSKIEIVNDSKVNKTTFASLEPMELFMWSDPEVPHNNLGIKIIVRGHNFAWLHIKTGEVCCPTDGSLKVIPLNSRLVIDSK